MRAYTGRSRKSLPRRPPSPCQGPLNRASRRSMNDCTPSAASAVAKNRVTSGRSRSTRRRHPGRAPGARTRGRLGLPAGRRDRRWCRRSRGPVPAPGPSSTTLDEADRCASSRRIVAGQQPAHRVAPAGGPGKRKVAPPNGKIRAAPRVARSACGGGDPDVGGEQQLDAEGEAPA